MNGLSIGTRSVALGVCLALACGREEAIAAPPPLPEAAPTAAAKPAESATEVHEAAKPAKHEAKPRHEARPAPEAKPEPKPEPKASAAKPTASKPRTVRENEPQGTVVSQPVAPTPAPTPAPIAAAPAAPPPAPPAPAPRKAVTVPRTEHVHVEIPAGLQADLDADPRMQRWVDSVVSVADGCHARARGNTGTIEVGITMHENDRPSADVRSMPASLASLVPCATGSLMRVKMPLFTGREGTRYTVRVIFE